MDKITICPKCGKASRAPNVMKVAKKYGRSIRIRSIGTGRQTLDTSKVSVKERSA